MRIRLRIDGDVFEVDVRRGAGTVETECEGERRRFEVVSPVPAIELRADGRTHAVAIRSDQEARIDGQAVAFSVDGFEPGPAPGLAGAAARASIRAMMPGRVVKVALAQGDEVEQGAPVLVLEAMKMQNEVASPMAGRVVELKVKAGDTVESGRVLAVVEASAGGRKE